jgi:hypothetical protein
LNELYPDVTLPVILNTLHRICFNLEKSHIGLQFHGTALYYTGNGKALASGNSRISLFKYYMKIASRMLCDTVNNGF